MQSLIAIYAKFIRVMSNNKPVILVAHDWGGAIAWPLAAFYPELIDKLVILNAAHPSTFTREMIHNSEQRQKSAYIHTLISENGVKALSKNHFQYLQSCIFDNVKIELDANKRQMYIDAWSQEGAINGMLNYYRAMPQLAPPNDEQVVLNGPMVDPTKMKIPNIRINQATLVIWGEQDQAFVSQVLDDLDHYVPNCSLLRLPDATHWLVHEYPNEINSRIEQFINQ